MLGVVGATLDLSQRTASSFASHGDLAERIHDAAHRSGRTDITHFDVPDATQPFGYNPLRHVHADKRSLAASGLIEIFKKLWIDAWGPRLEHILRNAIYALLERDDATLPDILRLLTDKRYREETARAVTNQPSRAFWLDEYSKYTSRLRADAISPIQSKVGALIADPVLRRVLTSAPEDIRSGGLWMREEFSSSTWPKVSLATTRPLCLAFLDAILTYAQQDDAHSIRVFQNLKRIGEALSVVPHVGD